LDLDWASLHKILSDTTRRSILELLAEREALSYTDIMTLLHITNTGKLNYHLKVLGDLLTKDDAGRYRLTDQGRQAANLLRTFPERVQPESKLKGLKIATAVVLILVGIYLIATISLAMMATAGPAYVTTSEATGVSAQPLSQNITVSLTGWPTTVPTFSMAWSAAAPVHIYILNQTQNDEVLSAHSEGGRPVYNFTGPPGTWSEQYYTQSGNVTVNLPPGQYHFYACSTLANYLDSFTLSQTTQPEALPGGGPSPFFYLFGSIIIVLGAVSLVLAASILTRRILR